MQSPLFLFDGEAMPFDVEIGYLEESEQMVEGTRTANAKTVAQPINRRLNKFSGLVFPKLSLEGVNWLKQKVANFEVLLTYYDSEANDVLVRRCYFGDLSATPCEWDTTYIPVAKPIMYKDVKVNIIDMGY